MEENTGWWYTVPKPNQYIYENIEDLFPSFGSIFGLDKQAMEVFLLECGVFKMKGKQIITNNSGWDKSRNQVNNRMLIEITTV